MCHSEHSCNFCPPVQFIAGFANMRARNYAIPEVDKLQVGNKCCLVGGIAMATFDAAPGVKRHLLCHFALGIPNVAHMQPAHRPLTNPAALRTPAHRRS